ncbi:flagellar basal-body MS-ring/collar protein FliF [Pseudomonas veronii]|uniref:flagellar basal-body MS-ring/collar protein FliF n=1 Tax=Pseudomonas TaxID=286 RepID=UPI000AC06CA6|nr:MULTISPECIES: flagellar basal-body MS-ring/collar protein FliF [Pseudomonas]MCT8960368.1 flagellar M-ring protein FliF [Pseudomonas veronii]MCT9828055.1 flagellar basal-body MS-ring/collar protein FliF [Pseudomonas veronii]NMX40082.1 flagellar basal body M-ring protein FliF [Pseudomonas veronii]NMX53829.1 flagellar basal body M-ring protein FliF [Pseudomonas veronii]PUB36304.1 flagellar M-ring protein FliF [Pseudomonas sp. GV105]
MSTAVLAKGAQKNLATRVPTQPLEALTTLFRNQPLVPLLLAAAAAVAVVVALLLWAREPEYRVLFSGLGEADGGQIISELDKRAIPYRLSEGGNTILVPGDKMNALRLQLAEQGLPKGGSIGFELLDKQAFGVSQFAEHLNYQRGLEGELARTIESLGPVAKARVHLVMAKQSVFVRDREAARASVVLTLQPGRELGQSQASAIVHLVTSSVPELSVDAVTVVDQNGRLLSQVHGDTTGPDGTQLDYVHEIERSYQRRIEDILTPLLGSQNVHAQVVAQVDFSTRESTAERYAPNQDSHEAAVRSKQTSEHVVEGDDAGRGVPGALTNSPPNTPAPTKATAPTPAGGTATAADAKASKPANATQSERMINYEVDRNVEHVKSSLGTIQRLTTAVVVNYRTVLKDGAPTAEPLSKEELENINNLVRQAMGFTESRGDALQVINSPFVTEDTSVAEPPWWKTPEAYNLLISGLRYLLVAFAALLLWWLVLRPMQRRNASRNAQMLAASAEPGTALMPTSTGTSVVVAGQDNTPHTLPRKSAVYEQNMQSLQQIAAEDPRLVAMIVRGWMKKND